jgi:hypothetical protein
VCWLSCGKVLRQYFELTEEINVLMEMKDFAVPEL